MIVSKRAGGVGFLSFISLNSSEEGYDVGMLRKTETFFHAQLNSVEHGFYLLINVKMPTIVFILTFRNREKNILGLSEAIKAEFLYIFILMSI